MLPESPNNTFQYFALYSFVPATGIGLVLSARISLALPARALGHSEITFWQTWKGSRGNVLRLIAGFILTGSLSIGLFIVWQFEPKEVSRPLYAMLETLFQLGMDFLAMPAVSFLLLAYRRLIQQRNAATPA
jgi:hypothetical protein